MEVINSSEKNNSSEEINSSVSKQQKEPVSYMAEEFAKKISIFFLILSILNALTILVMSIGNVWHALLSAAYSVFYGLIFRAIVLLLIPISKSLKNK